MRTSRVSRLGAVTGLIFAIGSTTAAPPIGRVSADGPQNGAALRPTTGAGAAVTPGPLVAVPLGATWQEFSFTVVGVQAQGCLPADPIGLVCEDVGVNAVAVGAPPWTFTAPRRRRRVRAHRCLPGRRSVRGLRRHRLAGTHLRLRKRPPNCGPNPDVCFASVNLNSHGSFSLGPGAHSLTIKPTASPNGARGAAFFRVLPPSCTLTQMASAVGGNVTLTYTYDTTVPVTWNLYFIVGDQMGTFLSTPIGVTEPPVSMGPFTFPFPARGGVGFLTTMTTPTGGILCSHFAVIDTGAAPSTTGPTVVPKLAIPVPQKGNGVKP